MNDIKKSNSRGIVMNYPKKAVAVLVVLMLSFSLQLSGQDLELTPKLRWLPNGEYINVLFLAKEPFLENCPEDIQEHYYKNLWGKPDQERERELPASLRCKWQSLTRGVLSEVELVKSSSLENQVFNPHRRGSASMGSYDLDIIEKEIDLRIYFFDQLKEKLAVSLKNGEIKKYKKSINGFPAYSFLNSRYRSEYLLVPVSETQLLFAPDENYITKMIKSSKAEEENILKNPHHKFLDDLKGSLKFKWVFYNSKTIGMAINQYLYFNDPENKTGKEVAAMFLRDGQMYVEASSWSENGVLCWYSKDFFDSSEEAKKELGIRKGKLLSEIKNPKTDKMDIPSKESSVFKVEGSTLVQTSEYTPPWFRYQVEYMVSSKASKSKK